MAIISKKAIKIVVDLLQIIGAFVKYFSESVIKLNHVSTLNKRRNKMSTFRSNINIRYVLYIPNNNVNNNNNMYICVYNYKIIN